MTPIFGWEPLGPEQNSPGTMTVTRIEGVLGGIVSAPYPALSLIACGRLGGIGELSSGLQLSFFVCEESRYRPDSMANSSKGVRQPNRLRFGALQRASSTAALAGTQSSLD